MGDAVGMTVESGQPAAPFVVRRDRSVGAVLGGAAGDALGAGYEFGPPIPDDVNVGMVGGGDFGWAPGEWTDDTQMAACVLAELAAGSSDVTAIGEQFLRWFANGPADVGVQTSAVLRNGRPLDRAAAEYAAARPDSSAGNGSLMRTGPVALAAPGDPAAIAELASAVSGLTHADPDCTSACVLWSVAVDHQIHHAPASDQPWDFADAVRVGLDLLPSAQRIRWAALIDEAATSSPRDFPKNGWVVHAFQAALAAACSTPVPDGPTPAEHLRLALESAVRCGGDTDTVAAIAGSLLGSRWGATAVPVNWTQVLHGHAADRSPTLRATDLDAAARLAVNGGRPDPHQWPGRPSMVEHYLELPVPPSGRHAELQGVRFGDVVSLAHALDDGVDSVVSLCRMGTADVPGHVDHLVVGLVDTNVEDNPNLVHLLEQVADHLHAERSAGRAVFVHCVAAENRTPTVAASWLVRHHGHSPTDALAVAGAALNPPAAFLQDGVHRVRPAG